MSSLVSRRALLATTALVPVALLVGCASGSTVPVVLQQAAQDVSLIANGLAAVLSSLQPLVSATQYATIAAAVATIQQVATSIAGASTIAQAQPLVQQLETALNAIVDAVAGLNLPGTIGDIITAASVLLPVIETAVGFITSTPAAVVARYRTAPTGTTSENHTWARLTLRAAARR